MMDVIERELGTEGIAYMKQCLQQAGGLSEKLLNLPILTGEVFAALPAHISADRAKLFDVGGLVKPADTRRWLTKHLAGLWQKNQHGTFVVQDVWAKSTDRVALQSPCKSFFCNSRVYYFIEQDDLDEISVQTIMRCVTSFLFLGVFTTYMIRAGDVLSEREVDESIIDAISKSTIEIFVSAYDQEGIVGWRRQTS